MFPVLRTHGSGNTKEVDTFWSSLLKALPFQYLAYFHAIVFLGKVQGWELMYGLLTELAWAVVFIVGARLLFRFGLRRYSAYGG